MASAESSSQHRWVMLAMLLLISMVTYLDRVNISIADKYGARRVLTFAIIWWSAFTAPHRGSRHNLHRSTPGRIRGRSGDGG